MDESLKAAIAKRLANKDKDSYGGLLGYKDDLSPDDYRELSPEGKGIYTDLTGISTIEPTRRFEDTGRKARNTAEILDSFVGVPIRTAANELLNRGYNVGRSLLKGAKNIGSDPEDAPTWSQILNDSGLATSKLGNAFASTLADFAEPNLPMGKVAGVAGTIAKKELPAILKQIDTAEKAVALKGAEKEAYLKALDEAFGSRAERMKQMGFDDYKKYHGGREGYEKLKPSGPDQELGQGVYVTSKRTAKGFGPMQYELNTKGDILTHGDYEHLEKVRPFLQDIGWTDKKIDSFFEQGFLSPQKPNKSKITDFNEFQEASKKAGFSGIGSEFSDSWQETIFDPKNIRSTDAAFDPRFADSDLLLAGGIGSVGQNPEALAIAQRLAKIKEKQKSKED